jgi:hypothetical protein
MSHERREVVEQGLLVGLEHQVVRVLVVVVDDPPLRTARVGQYVHTVLEYVHEEEDDDRTG